MPQLTTRMLPWYAVPWVIDGWQKVKRYPLIPLAILIFVLVIPAIFAPWVAPHDAFQGSLSTRLTPPVWQDGGSTKYLLGTDDIGRDMLSRLIHGARLTLLIGIAVVALSIVAGIILGLVAGYFRGVTEIAIMRLVRSSMLEVLDSEFVKLARVKGIPEWKVVWKHCLRNASIAPLTVFAIIAGSLLTGSVVTETVFTWPGVGLLVVDAVRSRDFQVVQAVVIVFAGIFILTNLMVDILYAYLDPRIRYQ